MTLREMKTYDSDSAAIMPAADGAFGTASGRPSPPMDSRSSPGFSGSTSHIHRVGLLPRPNKPLRSSGNTGATLKFMPSTDALMRSLRGKTMVSHFAVVPSTESPKALKDFSDCSDKESEEIGYVTKTTR